VKTLALKVLFVSIGLAWLGFTTFELAFGSMGNCAGDGFCEGRKSLAGQVVFWRGLFGALVIVLAYRFFRKDADV
jgi:hypothetical protein